MNIQNVNIIPLFPTPLLSYEVEIEEAERSFLLNQYPDNVVFNTCNSTSLDVRILERGEVGVLREKLLSLVNDAFMRIHNPKYRCKLYITQSWLNFSVKGQSHPLHHHTNSMYSAVLYLKVSEGDSISFGNPKFKNSHDINSNHYGLYNCNYWSIPVKENLLLIFPSTTPHGVPTLEHDNMRVSLSFNTFIRGEIGDPANLNHLVL